MSINIDKINNVKTNNSLNCNPKKVSFAKSKDMPNDSFEFSRPITRAFTGCGDKINVVINDYLDVKKARIVQDVLANILYGDCNKTAKNSEESVEQVFNKIVSSEVSQMHNVQKPQSVQDTVLDVEIVDHVPAKMRLVTSNKKAAQQSSIVDISDIPDSNKQSGTVQRSYMEVDGNKVTINVSKYQEEFDEFMRNFPNI